MTVAGIRDRLLKDSFKAVVNDALNTLGWMDPGRSHNPITVIDKPNHWDVPVKANTVAVDFIRSEIWEWEVGSPLTQEVHVAYAEIYAQNDSLGMHLSNDLRDWLRGRLQATPVGITFPIYDYRQGATPPVIGHMTIGAVSALRNVTVSEEIWMRHWFRVRCEILDFYGAEAP